MADRRVTARDIADLLDELHTLPTRGRDPAAETAYLARKAELLTRIADQRAHERDCQHAEQARQIANHARRVADEALQITDHAARVLAQTRELGEQPSPPAGAKSQ